MRARVGQWLRRFADRIDYGNAPRGTMLSFTFEKHRGIVTHTDGRGCRLWYLSESDYDRAHSEAVDPTPRVNWRTIQPVTSRTDRDFTPTDFDG